MPSAFPRPLELIAWHEGRVLARCALRKGRYGIGRDQRNHIVLDAPAISGKHAQLTLESESEIFLEDLGSANGTTVDGQPLAERTRVTTEARIEIGQTALEFQRAGLPPAAYDHLPEGLRQARRYQRGEVIGRRKDAVIHAARDLVLDREVALRTMLPESQARTAEVLRFIRTVQIASQLQHPNILPVHDLGLDEDRRLFCTTRFIDGEPLAAILDRIADGDRSTLERYPFSTLLSIFDKACDAVAFAHSRDVVHCALRPESITVGGFGKVFVESWSSARIFAAGEDRVRAVAIETPPPLCHYTAPEQAVGAGREIDQRTDVYALGGILHRIVTLSDPLDAETPRARPHWPAGSQPEYLAEVAAKALNTARADRHESVLALQQAIAGWQEEPHSTARHPTFWKQVTGMLRL